jgi:energy-converting hydrogenase Eha subunit H
LFTATIPLGLLVQVNEELFGRINSVGVALSAFTNITTTAIISFRILTASYHLKKSTHPQLTKIYTKAVIVLVESAAPCAILGIVSAFPIPSALLNPYVWEYTLFPIWSMSLVSLCVITSSVEKFFIIIFL